jgi:hypothetical protein
MIGQKFRMSTFNQIPQWRTDRNMRCVQWMAPSTMAMAMAVLTSLTPPAAVAAGVAVDEIALPLERLAFGSCNHQSRPQPLWSAVQATDPQLWLWMGDAVCSSHY